MSRREALAPPDVRVLVLSGSMGAGKTTVLAEATDILTAANLPHAAIDLDFLNIAHHPGGLPGDLALRNLDAVWSNYAAAGISNLLLCEPIVSVARRQQICDTIRCTEVVVCRLRASRATMEARVRQRETGLLQERYIARVAELERELDAGVVEDFSIDNDGRQVSDVAREVLVRAGWL